MMLVARIVAVVVAMIVYLVVFLLGLLVALLFMVDDGETTSNGQFDLQVVELPDWVGSVWLAGLAGVIWLVGFGVPWWKRKRAPWAGAERSFNVRA